MDLPSSCGCDSIKPQQGVDIDLENYKHRVAGSMRAFVERGNVCDEAGPSQESLAGFELLFVQLVWL